jgi:CheY-like chemotaxis protein
MLHGVLASIFEGRVAPAREAAPRGFDAQIAQQRPLKILVAEDNAVNQKVAVGMLAKLGYRADVVANGMEALHAVARQRYDVVLMDVHMPEMDGIHATRAICERFPSRTERPRIVAMTASALEEERGRCLAAGMDDYLSKPVTTERLVPIDPAQTEADPGAEEVDRALDRMEEELGPELLLKVIDAFLVDAPELLAAMREGLDAGDAPALAMAAHQLKSTSATLGAAALSAASADLERMGKRSDLEGAPGKLAACAELLEQVTRALSAYRACCAERAAEAPA